MVRYDAPSPIIPFFFVATMVGMAFLPWIRSCVSATVLGLQQMPLLYLSPLLIILGISLISTFQKWMNPAGSPARQPNAREWRASCTGDDVLGSQQSDGAGIGLFVLLVVALVLIPWR
uniref:Uncharacterized protein n=1 Tax=Physcomitrium patens TaxID=3218 RepID=A0A2K1K6K1_PHYPA|nr:hypothetical protein PHYPA_011291 [Physcomitrium patens]